MYKCYIGTISLSSKALRSVVKVGLRFSFNHVVLAKKIFRFSLETLMGTCDSG